MSITFNEALEGRISELKKTSPKLSPEGAHALAEYDLKKGPDFDQNLNDFLKLVASNPVFRQAVIDSGRI